MDKVKTEVEAWEKNGNTKDAKINWQFTKEEALIKLKRLCPTIHTEQNSKYNQEKF